MKIAYLDKGTSVHSMKFVNYWRKTKYVLPNKEKITMCPISFAKGEIWNKHHDNSHINIYHQPLPRPRYFHFFLSGYVKNVIRKIQPDLIHATFLTTNGYYVATTGFHPLLQRGMGSDILIQSKQWPYSMWVRKALNGADLLIAGSNYQKEVIQKLGYDDLEIRVIPIGLELKKFTKNVGPSNTRKDMGWLDENKIIIYNRNHRPVYGWKYFLQAFKKVNEVIPETRLIALGNGPETNSYLNLVKRLGIRNKISWVGAISNGEVPHYLNSADLYVSASLSDGSSVSLQEAMACGLPVVVSDVPAIMEWVTHRENGLVVPRGDPEKLADAIIELLRDDNMAKRFGKKNREIAEKRSSYEKYMKGVKECYRELLERYNKI